METCENIICSNLKQFSGDGVFFSIRFYNLI